MSLVESFFCIDVVMCGAISAQICTCPRCKCKIEVRSKACLRLNDANAEMQEINKKWLERLSQPHGTAVVAYDIDIGTWPVTNIDNL